MDTCSAECNAECCKRWWVTLLPEELDRAAQHSNIPRKIFVEEKCVLFAELFPKTDRGEGIVVYNQLLPKALAEKVKECFGVLPDFFLALPFIAFKRLEGNCIHLNSSNLCSIYEARPRQCELFPALSADPSGEPAEQYAFCGLAKEAKAETDEGHMKKTRDYFSEVEGSGFRNMWHSLPVTGAVKIGDTVFPVSRQDFLALLGPYA